MFFDEEMLLDLRLNIMNEYVDKFVITESVYMHSGKPKKLIFDINKFSKFKDKIIYIVVDKPPPDLLKIDNKDNIIFPGTFVEIKLFVTDKLSVLALHPNNLAQNQLGSYVLVVDENNKVQTRQIETSYSNNDLVIVKKGLQAGDKVIVSALKQLKVSKTVNAVEVKNPINK